jgi:hypothetical protein
MATKSASLLLLRGLTTAIWLAAGFRYYAYFLLGDWTLYFIQKVLRRDFHYCEFARAKRAHPYERCASTRKRQRRQKETHTPPPTLTPPSTPPRP